MQIFTAYFAGGQRASIAITRGLFLASSLIGAVGPFAIHVGSMRGFDSPSIDFEALMLGKFLAI